MHSFLQDIDSWDHSLPRWPDPNYGPLLPTHKISRKQTRRPRPPLSDIQNLPRCPFPSDLSSLSQFKLKMRQLQQQSDRWQHPATGEHFQKHTRSGLIRAHTQSESCELVPQEKKRPNSCRQVSSSLRPRHNKLEQSFTLLGEKTPSIHSRHRSKSHSQHKHKATMTINQLEQGKVQHILRCLNKLK